MIIRRCCSNTFLQYVCIQVINLSKVFIDRMVSTRAFYIITEAEVIYYTPGQPGFQSNRIKPQQGITNSTTYPIFIPPLNGPQGSNTHATCL